MNGMDWQDWWETYMEVFQEEAGDYPYEDAQVEMAKRAFRKGQSPQRAAREDARFMLTGE